MISSLQGATDRRVPEQGTAARTELHPGDEPRSRRLGLSWKVEASVSSLRLADHVTDARARQAALGILALAGTLPLQWQVLATTPLGVVRWFHLGALLLIVLARPYGLVLRGMRTAAKPCGLALVLVTLVGTVTAAAYSQPWADYLQQLLYAVVGLCVAAALMMAMARRAGRLVLVFTGVVATTSFLVVFMVSSQSLGLSPVDALRASLIDGSPDQLNILFRSVFATGGVDEARINVRHEVFAALMVSLYITWCASRWESFYRSALLLPLTLVTGLLVSISLSRAILLAAVLIIVVAATRIIIRARMGFRSAIVVVVLLTVSPFVVMPIYRLVERRVFSDTGSYEARLATFDLNGIDLLGRLLIGGGDVAESTHTMIGDAALRSGFIGGLAAAVLVGIFLRHTMRALVRFLRDGRPLDLAGFGAGALVLVRAFTIGGGLLHQVEWVAFALVLAVEVWSKDRTSVTEGPPSRAAYRCISP